MNDLDLCLKVVYGHFKHCVTFAIEYFWKPLERYNTPCKPCTAAKATVFGKGRHFHRGREYGADKMWYNCIAGERNSRWGEV